MKAKREYWCKMAAKNSWTQSVTFYAAIFLSSSFRTLPFASSEPCFKPEVLRLGALGARCHSNSASPALPCGMAVDGNINTLWMPDIEVLQGKRFPVYFEVTFNRRVLISGLEVLEYEWVHGTSKKLRFVFDDVQSHIMSIPKSNSSHEHWKNLVFAHQVEAQTIRIEVMAIHGIMFGGFKEIRFYGCNVQPKTWEKWTPKRRGYSVSSSENNVNQDLEESSRGDLTLWLSAGGIILGLAVAILVLSVCITAIVRSQAKEPPTEPLYHPSHYSTTSRKTEYEHVKRGDEDLYEVIGELAESLLGDKRSTRGSTRGEMSRSVYGKINRRDGQDGMSVISERTEPRSSRSGR